MPSKIQIRLIELLIVIAVVAAGLVWAERMAWRQISSLREELTPEQIAGFHSGHELQAAILKMHHAWRRSAAGTNINSRIELDAQGREVKKLIERQMDQSHSPDESQLSKEFAAAFDEYFQGISTSFNEFHAAPAGAASPSIDRVIETNFERLLALSEKLAVANQFAAEHFVGKASSTLTQLQRFLFIALLGLLASGVTMVAIAYRRTITPLQNNLTESRAIIERQEKLASLGVFATGIAHEIRNPLTAIKVRLFSLKTSHRRGTSEHEDLEVIENEIDRLERIVRDFLQFARPSEPDLKPMLAGELLREVADLLTSELAERSFTLRLELDAEEMILVDAGKMKQVLINFIQNAAESMEAGGTITLRSRLDKQSLNNRGTTAVAIDIEDTGTGMPPEVQRRLFDPFFTTKEDGTGLGLPIAARIVEKHGGVIRYQTQPNRGTTFSIVLPLAPKDKDEA